MDSHPLLSCRNTATGIQGGLLSLTNLANKMLTQIFGEQISPLLSPFRHIFGEDKPIHCQLPPGGALANCRSFGGATGPT